jgi:ubiquinone/menaquinone biosynthesis C-methylase UbiE
MPTQRALYKSTWDKLAQTEESACRYVADKDTFSEMADSAARTRDWLRETVGVLSTDTVLEIGCGVGRVGNVLAPLCREWIGTDASANMLAIARRNLAHPNVRFVELSGYDLAPVPDDSVDLVYCTVVFPHLSEWDRFNYVTEGYRVLRPKGRVFIDNVNLCSDAGWAIFEDHRKIPPQERPPHIAMTSTPAELTTYLSRAGFRDVSSRSVLHWVQAYATKP